MLWGWLIKGRRASSRKDAWKTEPRDESGRWTILGESSTGPLRKESGVSLTGEEEIRARHYLKGRPDLVKVRINPDPDADLQGIGFDRKGKRVYLYTASHKTASAEEKFTRAKDFARVLPRLRREVKAAAPAGDEVASVVLLIDRTAFRVGSTRDTQAEKQAFGATTLQAQHVRIEGDTVHFDFTGKKGVAQKHSIRSRDLARVMTRQLAGKAPEDRLFSVSEMQVNKYLARFGDFTAKDFRTYHASQLAREQVEKLPAPATPKAFQKLQKQVAVLVSQFLGNTPQIALKDYIDPTVFAPWEIMKGN
ncbi:MAG: Topoisomerase IB [Candidatus Gottesmanbacteria bacterium GW2011_GWB1_49_7]|uniref:DNA topoisomerase n=1 Tax=Candidatus Gottesmanbacteria bacterium GW2011_GWB1_49_7 TaxID=1618448 RepID=A0A0G1W433_9BACT|nr:MAG: Topoisomerase IB [Candidatus Gottesmanbacteria bacterium GW2011_GWB1_49_7]